MTNKKTAQDRMHEVVVRIRSRGERGEVTRLSTCDAWAGHDHAVMPQIASHFREQGWTVTRERNFGVDDWMFTPKLEVTV